jgi:hypothetical protein
MSDRWLHHGDLTPFYPALVKDQMAIFDWKMETEVGSLLGRMLSLDFWSHPSFIREIRGEATSSRIHSAWTLWL